jgi:hypothetical protein
MVTFALEPAPHGIARRLSECLSSMLERVGFSRKAKDRYEIKQSKVVWFPASAKRWYGVTDTYGMSHIAILDLPNGKGADWMKLLADEEVDRAQ